MKQNKFPTWAKYGLIFSALFIVLSLLFYFLVKVSGSEFVAIPLGLLLFPGFFVGGIYGLVTNGMLSVGSSSMSNQVAEFIIGGTSLLFWFGVGAFIGKIKQNKGLQK